MKLDPGGGVRYASAARHSESRASKVFFRALML